MKILKMDQGKRLTDVDAEALLSPSEVVINICQFTWYNFLLPYDTILKIWISRPVQ